MGTYEPTGFRCFMSPGGIEILEPIRPDADLQKFLDKRGEGVSAVAFTVQDAGKAKAKGEIHRYRTYVTNQQNVILFNPREQQSSLSVVPDVCLS